MEPATKRHESQPVSRIVLERWCEVPGEHAAHECRRKSPEIPQCGGRPAGRYEMSWTIGRFEYTLRDLCRCPWRQESEDGSGDAVAPNERVKQRRVNGRGADTTDTEAKPSSFGGEHLRV